MSANAEIIAELRRVLNERDEAREQLDLTKRELGRWVDRETKAARERDEAVKARDQYRRERDQARMAEERARESLDELDGAIYDCLPSDYDDDSPLDCVEHAADRLRDLAQERDEARADLREFVRQAENAYELLKPLEEGSDVVERAVGHLLTILRGRERPGPWAFDAVLKERDEARAEVERLREAVNTWAWTCDQLGKYSEGARVRAFRRGAEAMREACAARIEGDGNGHYGLTGAGVAKVLRALPIPEEP